MRNEAPIKVNLQNLNELNVGGKGGKEKIVNVLFPDWKRVDAPLFDFIKENLKIEVKKQTNLQWFDVGKYHNLNEEEKEIWMIFLCHKNGKIKNIYSVKLGKFIDTLCSSKKYQKLGWNPEVFSKGAEFKIKYPTLQFKVMAKILTVKSDFPSLFDVIF